MILIFDGSQTYYAHGNGEPVGTNELPDDSKIEAIIAQGSEQAIELGYTASLEKNVPFITILHGAPSDWKRLNTQDCAARHAVRNATLRLTDTDAVAMNDHLGTDDFRRIDPSTFDVGDAAKDAHDIWSRPSIVFHAPYAISQNAATASRLRPLAMRATFRTKFHVLDLSGTPKERRHAFNRIRAFVNAGGRPLFTYSESSTNPNLLSSQLNVGIVPFLETRIFRFLKKNAIPIGQFYRDVYWQFEDWRSARSRLKVLIYTAAYRYDLHVLKSVDAHIFLPSLPMAKYLPEISKISELPPAAKPVDSRQPSHLKLLYVGGLGMHYNLDIMVDAMRRHPDISLTLCVPQANWKRVEADYSPLPANVFIRHESNEGLRELYDEASAGILFVAPNEYRNFAVPMKYFEYQAHGKAIIATAGTYAGDLIESRGVGEAIPYSKQALDELLNRWKKEFTIVQQYAANARTERLNHTWERRAQTVVDTLSGCERKKRRYK